MTIEIQNKGTDQLSKKDIFKIVQNCHKLSCYQKEIANSRKPLPIMGLKLLIELMFDAGLRVSEALNLKPENVLWGHNIIVLKKTKGGWKKCKNAKKYFDKAQFKVKTKCNSNCKDCNGKGKIRTDQVTTVSNEMLEKLANYIEKYNLDTNQFFFESPSFTGHYITRDWVFKKCKELDKICDLNYYDFIEDSGKVIKGLDTHAFRKSLTKNMVDSIQNNEESMRIVIKQLRHKDPKTIMKYMMPSIESVGKARRNDKLKMD